MSLEIAVERLYEGGWMPVAGRLTQRLEDGRAYPAMADVQAAFAAGGLRLTVRHVALFDCYRAEWTGEDGVVLGYCVGATEAEAGVYALAQWLGARQGLGRSGRWALPTAR